MVRHSPCLGFGLALALALPLAGASGCDRSAPGAAAQVEVPVLSIDELAVDLARGGCRAVDANDAQLRRDVGVIPGAVLLSDYEAFSLSELPADRSTRLVFYCANEHCDASHVAARRARSAGYQQVRVLPAGILGWAHAGRAVDKPAQL